MPIQQRVIGALGGNSPSSTLPQGTYLHCHVILPIPCVEMWWIVIIEEHSDNDPIKTAYFWHIHTYFKLNAVKFHLANGPN